jgi:phytoene desaturase
MRQLYYRYPTYVGSSPYESPATLLVIPYIEFAFGGWYAKGGLYTIVEGLVELASRSNVLLLTDTQVDRIERRNGRVKGVVTHSGAFLPADVVVMNGDPARLNDLLHGPQGQTAGAEHRSLSGFVLLLGVKRTLSALHHHSVFFSTDYRREFYDLFGLRRFPEEPTVYVSAPSRNDRALTPGEGEALFVMANAPANGGDIWGLAQIASARRRVLDRLYAGGFPYVEADVAVETVWTPKTFERRYQMPGGAIYGSNSHGWRKAFLRPPNKHPRVGGLYCVGGGSHPGGGTPTVLLSARITCDLIEKYEIA